MTTRVRAGFCGALVLVVMLSGNLLCGDASAPPASAQAEPPATPTVMPPLDEGEVLASGSAIAVIKRICESFGQDNACNGRHTSLDGYSIDFELFRGRDPGQDPVPGVTVTLDQGGG